MFDVKLTASIRTSQATPADYQNLTQQIAAIIDGEPDIIANLANISAILYEAMEEINWLGFYVMKQGELVLGPFQGKVACIRIPVGKGVCGTAVATGVSQRVDDVNLFAGHIACDAASQSELVVPIRYQGKVVAVLDIDSPIKSRFSKIDQQGIEALLPMLETLAWADYAE